MMRSYSCTAAPSPHRPSKKSIVRRAARPLTVVSSRRRVRAAKSTHPQNLKSSAYAFVFVEKFDRAKLREQRTPLQYQVCVNKGTERPYTGEYWDNHEPGVYVCVVCGRELFASKTKFDSGTGWPSFWAPAQEGSVGNKEDRSLFMRRTEVECANCGSHLGHVFDEDRKSTRLNSSHVSISYAVFCLKKKIPQVALLLVGPARRRRTPRDMRHTRHPNPPRGPHAGPPLPSGPLGRRADRSRPHDRRRR